MREPVITISIRKAEKGDIVSISQQWMSINDTTTMRPFGGDSHGKVSHIEQLLQHTIGSTNAVVLVACTDNKIIATISGHVFDKPAVKLTTVGVIYSLWVDEAYRCQGVGQNLLDHLEHELIEKGALAFQVGWDTSNTTAEQWWQKRGYAPYETIASKVALPQPNTIY